MHKLDLTKLIVCRDFLKDDVFRALSREDGFSAWAVAALLVGEAESRGLAGNLLRAYTIYRLTCGDNTAARVTEMHGGDAGESLFRAFAHDIGVLSPLLDGSYIKELGIPLLEDYTPTRRARSEALDGLEEMLKTSDTPEKVAGAFLSYYRRYGSGDIATFKAFQWSGGRLVGIPHFEAMSLSDLIGCERQKEQLIGNTEAFVAGKPANNVLLVGARGTGKSSSVKALANAYYGRGLRILQLMKPDLASLPEIMETLRRFAGKKFLIFLDDLSFEESDPEYKYLKSAIEGGVNSRPENVLIYATSNRRHLIRESWRDRSDGQDELYRDDSMNETISLSDRFGLIIHYYAPNQQEYLAIIRHMLSKHGIELTPEELRIAGLRWEMGHSGRSGRTAGQFVAHYLGSR